MHQPFEYWPPPIDHRPFRFDWIDSLPPWCWLADKIIELESQDPWKV